MAQAVAGKASSSKDPARAESAAEEGGDIKQVWEWLAKAEDDLENTISEYNALLDDLERLERRDVTQEILIQQLRVSGKRAEAELNAVRAENEALNVLLSQSKIGQGQLREEIALLRKSGVEASEKERAYEVLLEQANADKRHLRERVREQVQEGKDLEEELNTLRKKEAVQVEVIQDQADAIREWQTAFEDLQLELKLAKRVSKTVPLPPNAPKRVSGDASADATTTTAPTLPSSKAKQVAVAAAPPPPPTVKAKQPAAASAPPPVVKAKQPAAAPAPPVVVAPQVSSAEAAAPNAEALLTSSLKSALKILSKL